jgi:hypothetical protein
MSKTITKLIAAVLISVVVPSYASTASAAPAGGALAIKNAASSNIEQVRWGWRGGWGWGRGWGWGVGAGVAAGALIGGALAAPYYYGGYYGGPYYYASPYYADPYYVVDDSYYSEPIGGGAYYGSSPYYRGAYARAGNADASYCARRYRSYDPRSGTFIGNDGRRHPCP